MSQKLVHFGAASDIWRKTKRLACVSACQPYCYKRGRRDSNPQPSDRQSDALSN